jgi:hypothetical protein
MRVTAGSEAAAITLDRELFDGGVLYGDGGVALRLGGVEVLIAPREASQTR